MNEPTTTDDHMMAMARQAFGTGWRKAGLALATLVAFSSTANAELAHDVRNPAAVDAVVDGIIEDGALPFLYVRLEDGNGRLLYEHSARNPDLMPFAVDGDSWVRIWSMSKIVTISTVMDLVEDGVIGMDDPITKYLPEFGSLRVAVGPEGLDLVASDPETRGDVCPVEYEALERPITVRHLINHQDGFYYPWTGADCLDGPFREALLSVSKDSADLIARMAALPLINQPGTDDFYGTGTTVLGLVAERATGQSLAELVSERITGPMDIEGLRYGLPEDELLPPRFSGAGGALVRARPGELDIFGDQVPGYDPDHPLFLGGEGMIGTGSGYARFLQMLLNEGAFDGTRILEPATIEEMTAPHTMTDSEWGYNGYNIWVSNGRLSTGETGPAPLWVGGGYEGTQYWIDPERSLIGVILTQIHAPPPNAANSTERIRMALYEQLGWSATTSQEKNAGTISGE